MTELQRLVHSMQMEQMQQVRSDEQAGLAIFRDMRNRYVSNLLGYIRLYRSVERFGEDYPDFKTAPWTPYRSIAWCNAAVELLTVPDEGIQDEFLRADPDVKDDMVARVLKDRGLYDAFDRWVELPVS